MKAEYLRLACLLTLLCPGCVSTQLEHPERSWPKPMTSATLKDFDGVYQDGALALLETGEPANNTTQLFVYLLGKAHWHEQEKGMRVEIRSAPDDQSLQIRLLDRADRQIDGASLHRGTDFRLAGGAIILQRSTGFRTMPSNWGPGIEHDRSMVRLTSNGSLIGQDTSAGAQLLMDIIPVAEATRYYWFWPKAAN